MRQQIEGIGDPEPPSMSARLAAFVREERAAKEAHEARKAAEAEAAASPPKSLVDELRELIGEPEQHEVPGLADARLLAIASGSQDASRPVREQLSGLLRGMWDQRSQDTDN